MSIQQFNDPGNRGEVERVKQFSNEVASMPVIALASRCYQLVEGGIDEGTRPYWNIQTFQNMFDEVVCSDAIPIPLLAYDDKTQQFFRINVKKADFNKIQLVDDENKDFYPTYDINAYINKELSFIGGEIALYRNQDYRGLYRMIQDGWDTLRVQYTDHSIVPPSDRKITPYDICEINNLVTITYRLLQFVLWYLNYTNEYPIAGMGAVIANRYQLMAMDLFLNMSMNSFIPSCRIPNHQGNHSIIARPAIHWHQHPMPPEILQFVMQFPGVRISDLEDARVISVNNMPVIYWYPLTVGIDRSE